MNQLVLSLFPGIGLLDMAFEQEGFCVVRGPDLLWGGDVRKFNPPYDTFSGIIGGPPCQANTLFAKVNEAQGKTVAEDMTPEYARCVSAALPNWFLMENGINVPIVSVPGYQVQVLKLNARWFGCEQSRFRVFQFGNWNGMRIFPREEALLHPNKETTCLASEGKAGRITTRKRNDGQKKSIYRPRRELSRFCQLQGLPENFLEDAPFTNEMKYHVIGNGVPLPMGRAIAKAIRAQLERENGIR